MLQSMLFASVDSNLLLKNNEEKVFHIFAFVP